MTEERDVQVECSACHGVGAIIPDEGRDHRLGIATLCAACDGTCCYWMPEHYLVSRFFRPYRGRQKPARSIWKVRVKSPSGNEKELFFIDFLAVYPAAKVAVDAGSPT